MSDRNAIFDLKPDKLLSPTLYRIRGAAHVILKVREEDAMDDALYTPLSNYRKRASKLTGISNKTLSCIKMSRRSGPRASVTTKRRD